MEQIMKEYKIKITDEQGNTRILEILSTDIEWSIKQYQRNRDPFKWEIYKEDEIEESNTLDV